MTYMLPPTHERGRTLHRIDPAGFQIVAERPPKVGEMFADCRGPAAWIWLTTEHIPTSQLIVKPASVGSYP